LCIVVQCDYVISRRSILTLQPSTGFLLHVTTLYGY